MKVFIATSLCLVSACDDLRKLSEKFVSIVISDIRTDLNWSEQLLHPLPLCSCEVLWSDWWRRSLTCDETRDFVTKIQWYSGAWWEQHFIRESVDQNWILLKRECIDYYYVVFKCLWLWHIQLVTTLHLSAFCSITGCDYQ